MQLERTCRALLGETEHSDLRYAHVRPWSVCVPQGKVVHIATIINL